MTKSCKDGEIWFPPENRCIKKLTTKPMNTTENVSYGAGAIIIGALAGWVLGRSSDDDDNENHTLHERNLILEHDMADFIPNISLIDIQYLDAEEITEINDAITIGVVKRLEEIEDQEELDSLFFDLEATQNFIETEADQEDVTDLVIPIVNHIQDMIEVLEHFETVDEMIEFLNGQWE